MTLEMVSGFDLRDMLLAFLMGTSCGLGVYGCFLVSRKQKRDSKGRFVK